MTVPPDTTDVLVIGAGIAGCATALAAARAGADVTVVTKADRPEGASTDWAQGGIATTREDPEQFKRDIIAASDETADPEAVDVLVKAAPDAVEDILLDTLAVPLDRAADGTLDYHREAAHSTSRILHVGASTGQHILRPFLTYLDEHPDITFLTDTAARRLIDAGARIAGAVLDTPSPGTPVYAGATVLATGGIGALYPRSTNPDTATGDGIAMASLVGAETADMAFVQFHPTAIDPATPGVDGDETVLISEAVRGAGAVLRNADGERFMPTYHDDAELAPRDVVARAIDRERERTGRVRLDVSAVPFEAEFADLATLCREHGVDPAEGIPVAPCEHFLCGGIDVDDCGRTTRSGLYAVGECSRTGVHGANRLASTSLLEGLVWGRRAGQTAATEPAPPQPSVDIPPARDRPLPDGFVEAKFEHLHELTAQFLGIRRTPSGLDRAETELRRLKGELDAYARTRHSRALTELRNATITAVLIAEAAAAEPESVGCHFLADTPTPTPAGHGRD